MIKTTPEQNKTLVLQAFDTLFNKRDYKAAERYWSSNYNTARTSRLGATACSIWLGARHRR
jgi:Tfp pilus assembly protein PilF